ncbi:MAG: hypothetical protein V1849_00365 [Chloroflexota bacterium]
MRWLIIAVAVIATLVLGVAGGYSLGYFIFQPQLDSYDRQTSELRAEVAQLSQRLSAQESRLLVLESERSYLQGELDGARTRLASYQGQVNSLQSRAYGEQQRLDKILGINVTQHYDWSYLGSTWQWELAIPLSLYIEYREESRPMAIADYIRLAQDPGDDPYIDKLVGYLNQSAGQKGLSGFHKLGFALAFVQSLPYTVDKITTPYDEYARYPIETLFDRGGDCEDTTILAAAILDRMGYDVALLVLPGAKHVALGIALSPPFSGSYYEHQGKKYFYVETTAEGWQIGRIPPEITDTKATVYPLR